MGWWPGETQTEVIIGAILTQSAAWTNVEKAISNLKSRGLLSFEALDKAEIDLLKSLIKPAGYFNQKAKKIKEFVKFAGKEFNFSIRRMEREDISSIREKLLGVFGIGEETADSIILYALNKPVFVVDAYTRRVLERHGIVKGALKEKYLNIQKIFHCSIPSTPENVEVYNEYHALLVNVGKLHCRKKPSCEGCPLKDVF